MIADARRTLELLETGTHVMTAPTPAQTASPQMGLFAPSAPSPAEEMLRSVEPDNLSPRDALDLVYRLKRSV